MMPILVKKGTDPYDMRCLYDMLLRGAYDGETAAQSLRLKFQVETRNSKNPRRIPLSERLSQFDMLPDSKYKWNKVGEPLKTLDELKNYLEKAYPWPQQKTMKNGYDGGYKLVYIRSYKDGIIFTFKDIPGSGSIVQHTSFE